MSTTSKFIAIEGIDGAGKSTQIDLLINYLKTTGIETKFVHFPRSNQGIFGELTAKFLRGDFGDAQQVHPQLVALLFAEDRKAFAPTINEWLAEGYFVLVDRYVLSNVAYQCAKLPTPAEKKELREWIYQLEYDYNQIPKPDLSIYLEVPFSFTKKSLTEQRSGDERNYLAGREDIHEKDMSLQLAVKQEYEAMVKTDKTIHNIRCYNEQEAMRPIADIHKDIVDCINEIIRPAGK